ncbi:hypothetical protein C9F11_20605 [Streptomyces sp. YIM 121038]|nr:hypothetical protein C9F11_20605 [Streptomyces sp. YIM 121038]
MGVREIRPQPVDPYSVLSRIDTTRDEIPFKCGYFLLQPQLPGNLHRCRRAVQQRSIQVEEV